MIGLTIMDISKEEMRAIVQYYLNENLLNTTFQDRHTSTVEDVHQRSNGRFVIKFREQKKVLTAKKNIDPSSEQLDAMRAASGE